MLPSEHLHYTFFVFMHRFGYLIGVEYMLPDYHVSWRTIGFSTLIVCGYTSQFYTIIKTDRTSVLQSMPILPTTIQAGVKYVVFLANVRLLALNIAFLRKMYRQCDAAAVESSVLIRWAHISKRVNFMYISLISSVVVAVWALPPYSYIITGKLELMLPTIVPGISYQSSNGMIWTTLLQMGFIFVTAMGMISLDLSIFLLIVQMCPMTEIITYKLSTLGLALRENDVGVPAGLREQHRNRQYLHNILRMHIEYVQYNHRMSVLFYSVFLAEVLCDGIIMCTSMFVLQIEVWFPLFLFWFAAAFKALIVCSLGALTDVYTNRVQRGFADFPWYKLPVDRKKFVMIFQRVQKPTVLMCGTIPLNMELFVLVMKNAFQVALLLLSMME